jgi:hypothetical protein
MQEGQWEIFHYDNSIFYKPCICGHRVKRTAYLYDRISKKIMNIGTTCLKKYGITNHLKNRILIQVLKENIMSLEKYDLEENVKTWIQIKYGGFRKKINECSQNEFDYYDIVAPFRRLLTDVCELVTEYSFDLIYLLREIEGDVESMNASTKHHMIDESDDSSSSISTIESDESFDEMSAATPVTEVDDIESDESFDEMSAATPITEVDEIGSVDSIVNSELSVEEPVEDGPKGLPIMIGDTFCTDPNCPPFLHRYCEIKHRLNNLKIGIIENNIHIRSIRIELEDCFNTSRELQEQIRKHRDFAENYIITYRRDKERLNNT